MKSSDRTNNKNKLAVFDSRFHKATNLFKLQCLRIYNKLRADIQNLLSHLKL